LQGSFSRAADGVRGRGNEAIGVEAGRERGIVMNLAIELEQEDDGRWIAEIDELNGVLVYGDTREEAIKNVKTLALRVIADRLENGESLPQQVESLIFEAA